MIIERITQPRCPFWVEDLLGNNAIPSVVDRPEGQTLNIRDSAHYSLFEAVAENADRLDADTFQKTVTELYGSIVEQMADRPNLHPVRWWNYVPTIRRRTDDGRCWYMVFNAGRDAAYQRWPVCLSHDGQPLAASALDARSSHMVVHLLAASEQGQPVQNPRQVSPSDYSHRYGPIPPHFARATKLQNGGPSNTALMLVAGTASIVGEDSIHQDNLEEQLRETMYNIATVVSKGGLDDLNGTAEPMRSHKHPGKIAGIEEVRAYVVQEADIRRVEESAMDTFPDMRRLEIVDADLCRENLLVEIEVTAHIKNGATVARL